MQAIFLFTTGREPRTGLANSTRIEHLLQHLGEYCTQIDCILDRKWKGTMAGWAAQHVSLPPIQWHGSNESVFETLGQIKLSDGPILIVTDEAVIVPEPNQFEVIPSGVSTYGDSALLFYSAERVARGLPASGWDEFVANYPEKGAIKPRKRYPIDSDEAHLYANRRILGAGFSSDDALERSYTEEFAVIPPVYIDPSAEIIASVIGPYASIGPGAVIEDSIIRSSVIDQGAVVKSTILEASLIGRSAEKAGQPEVVWMPPIGHLDQDSK